MPLPKGPFLSKTLYLQSRGVLRAELPSSSFDDTVTACWRRGLNPEEYLTDVLARLPSMKIHQIHELLPGQWTPPSANTS